MEPIEHRIAIKKVCPFAKRERGGICFYCFGENCMAWKEINPRIEREDHSGGREMMQEQRGQRGLQEIKREDDGSVGMLILEAQGVCELIDKEER